MHRLFIYNLIAFNLILGACSNKNRQRVIDLKLSEQIIPYMNNYGIKKIAFAGNNLIINDTLILLDTVYFEPKIWIKDTLNLEEWSSEKNINPEITFEIRDLIKNSKNIKIIKENNAYFFTEGGWIDSEYGKVYSKDDISDNELNFKFERIKDIKLLEGQDNWYDYYAD